MSTTTASVPARPMRRWLIGLTLVAMVGMLCATPAPGAHADTAGVSTESELATALDASPAGRITLDADITVTSFTPTVSSDTVIDLAGHRLTAGRIVVEAGVALTIDDSTADASGNSTGILYAEADSNERAGIRLTGATLVVDAGTVIARGGTSFNFGGAGIGGDAGADGTSQFTAGANGAGGGTVVVNGGSVTATATRGAGIGGGRGGSGSAAGGDGGNGGNVTITGGTVSAHGRFGAGIGGATGGNGVGDIGGGYGFGGFGGSGGTVTITGGSVSAFGDFGAGIGGGSGAMSYFAAGGSGGAGATVTMSGGQLVAEGFWGAGVGGASGGIAANFAPTAPTQFSGRGGNGSTVTISAGQLTAIGNNASGVGGADGPPPDNGEPGVDPETQRAIGGSASVLTIGADAVVTASGTFQAVGPGRGPLAPHRSIALDGELVLPAGQSVTVFAGTSISGSGQITGEGTIANAGIITPLVYEVGNVTVTGVNHAITFASALSGATPASRVVHVLAPSFAEGARSFPASPVAPGVSFLGWAANPDGSGAPPTLTTALSGDATLYGVWDDESYLLASDIASPLVGDELTVSVAASDGDPAGDLSAAFTFTADTPDVTIVGNRLSFTTPGDWTITATHTSTGVHATLPITVGVDRTNPATIELSLSTTTVDQGGSVTASVTGTDAWGNPLGDLTDLATLTSDHASDVVGPGPVIRFPTASTHVITATVGTVSHAVAVTVVPAATGALAGTGADIAAAGAAVVALLLLGGGLLGLRGMRRARGVRRAQG